MEGPLSRTADALVGALARPLGTLVALESVERIHARVHVIYFVHDVGVGAAGRQLAQRLLHRQVPAAQRLAVLAAVVGTRRSLAHIRCPLVH